MGADSAEQAEEGYASSTATILLYVLLPSGVGLASGIISHWFASDVDAEHQKGKVAYFPNSMTSAGISCPFHTQCVSEVLVF